MTAIVTGAGTGIGRAIALRFAEGGIAVALAGRRPAPLEDTVSQIRSRGGEALSVTADVTDRTSVQDLVDRTVAEFGRVDVLVNNAGINTPERGLEDIPPETWDQVIQVNLTGSFNCIRALLPRMKEQRGGLIINIASMCAKRAHVISGAAYSASKFGMVSLAQSVNEELREIGIRACVIFPGEVETPILESRPTAPSRRKLDVMLQADDIASAALMVALMPDRAIVEEITVFPRQVVEA